mgnify:CR=1 FL=1
MPGESAGPGMDRNQEEDVSAAALGGEAASRRLAHSYLVRGRLRTRALFASLFGVTQVAAALLVASALLGRVATGSVIAWTALVAAANLWVHGRAAMQPSASSRQDDLRAMLEALLLGIFWIALPAAAFAGQPLETRVVLAGATIAVIVSAVGLASMPAATLAFMSVVVLGFGAALLSAIGTLSPLLIVTFVGIAVVAISTVGRISRWTFGQLKDDAEIRAESESIRLLLREYEDRGVGWLWQTDAENRIVYVSARMGGLLGRSADRLSGQSLPAVLGGGALGAALIERKAFGDLDMEVRTREGMRWIRFAGDPVLDGAGIFQGFRGVGHDITEARRTQERLTQLANLDVLCGVPNRGRMRQLIGDALAACRPEGKPCALMFLDLDGFKPVNDRFGHPKGDLILKDVAQRLRAEVGDRGQVGRVGGDEFAIILCDAGDRSAVEALAQRLVRSLAEPFYLDRMEVRIGASIGCAFGPTDGRTIDELIQRADLALYRAKAEGRGTCRFFDAGLQQEADGKVQLERELRQGLKTGQFRLLYQPLIDAASQRLVGFEALIRWHHPTRGVVPPCDFIPQAEESGLIVPLGEWVVREACRALAQWGEVTVAVNVSPRQLVSPALPGVVRDALAKYRLAPNRLEMEVTESVFMADSSGALEVLRRLRAMGLGIALDDFGTGYSSLGYLTKAVFHKLKIDCTFVREAAESRETVAIIQSIVALARSFRMIVTAEGVETEEDFARMRDLGCHQVQGYHFGRPMTFDEASELVSRERQAATA